MTKIINITIVGSGNVATHLSKAFIANGIIIDNIYSRNLSNAKKLTKEVGGIPTNKISKLSDSSDLYLFAVSDSAIPKLTEQLSNHFGNHLKVAHTSGMIPSTVFKDYFNDYGVFYPLQTFTKNRKLKIGEIPFFITSNKSSFRNKLFDLANMLSDKVHLITDSKRKTLHVTAVFVNNFTNYLYSIADEILTEEKLKLEFLYPLIKETAIKVTEGKTPSQIQTGPAKRNDGTTINAHIQYLSKYPQYKDIYQQITKMIIESNRN